MTCRWVFLAPMLLVDAGLAPAADERLLERTLEFDGSRVEITLRGTPVQEAALWRWIDNAGRAVSTYFGRFPVPRVRLAVRIERGGRIGSGLTRGGPVPSINIAVGADVTLTTFRDDWVLTHEMVHLAFPDLTSDDVWAEEGMATYIEPIARARIGTLPGAERWRELVFGLPQGLPGPRDEGLHGTRSWARKYWGGALYWLLADVRLRESTSGRCGLEHALRGVLQAGGSIRTNWSLEKTLRVADDATGVSVLLHLYREMAFRPVRTDLDALWQRLGVRHSGGGVAFDDDAPLAAVRRAITPAVPRQDGKDHSEGNAESRHRVECREPSPAGGEGAGSGG